MIEINLIDKSSQTALPTIAGINLNEVNFKLLISFLLLYYGGKQVVDTFLSSKLESARAELQIQNTKVQALMKKSRETAQLQEQIEGFEKEEKILNNRLQAVKKVIEERKNPYKILDYISENIPPTVWLNSISLENDQIILEGESTEFQPVGRFQKNLEDSVYFVKENLRLISSETIDNSEYGLTTQKFTIEGKILRYTN